MSWNLPSGAYQYPDENDGRSPQGDKTHSFSFKGLYDALQTAANALQKGDVIVTGWVYSSHELRRAPGDLGVLTISCTPPNPTSGSGTEQDPIVAEPLKDKWSIHSVRNDVSVLAYCGESEGANPNRAMIEAWMKEPDGQLAKQWKFQKSDGTIEELTGASLAVAKKIAKGIEAVIRFFPVVTRTRTYAECPPACLENVGFIDTPPAPAGTAKKPSGLANAVNRHQWLKVKDDADELDNSNWTRTEAWWGIPKTDDPNNSPWDADLYGANRWPMPYEDLGGDPT